MARAATIGTKPYTLADGTTIAVDTGIPEAALDRLNALKHMVPDPRLRLCDCGWAARAPRHFRAVEATKAEEATR